MDLPELDKREKMPFNSPFAINSNGLTNMINNASTSNTLGIIRSEELSKMFPTPPSIEQHTNSSPGGIGSLHSDHLNENIDNVASSSHNMDSYQNFGSPPEEPIEVSDDDKTWLKIYANLQHFRTGLMCSSLPKCRTL
jgi:hypothetical protein